MEIFGRVKLSAALLGLSILLALPTVSAVDRAAVENRPIRTQSGAMTLWSDRPAPQWDHATAVGSGRLGAMIFGGVGRERIQLNEETLWSGGPRDTVSVE